MERPAHITTRRGLLIRFVGLSAGALALPLIQACSQAPAAGPTSAPAATTAPAAVAAKPTTDTAWEDMWKKAGQPYQGVTLRLPVGGRGHWGANEEASKDFERRCAQHRVSMATHGRHQ